MNNNTCHLIKDLLPLYVDDAVSQESAESIRAHLAHCESCRGEYEILTKELAIPTSPKVKEEDGRVLKQFKRMWQLQKLNIFFISVALTLALVGFGFVALWHYIGEAEVFNPKMTAVLWQADIEGQWQQIAFEDSKYLIFDSPFYEKELVLDAMSTADVELRLLDSNGEVVFGPQVLEAGKAVDVSFLENDVPYIVEIKASGEYLRLVFR